MVKEETQDKGKQKLNILIFLESVACQLKVQPEMLQDYVFAALSMGIGRDSIVYREIDRIYSSDKLRYFQAVVNSRSSENILMKQSNLIEEVKGRRVLGVLLCAESDSELRNKIIRMLRKNYVVVYNAVRKRSRTELKNKYLKLDDTSRSIESKFDAVLYFYFSIYCFPDAVDQLQIFAIIKDIVEFCTASPITADIDRETERYKDKINQIKNMINKKYGKIQSYEDILNNTNKEIAEAGEIFEVLLLENKYDIRHLFGKNQYINMDKLILPFLKSGYNVEELDSIASYIISEMFLQGIINEYRACRNLYFENCQEKLYFRLSELETKYKLKDKENEELNAKFIMMKEEIGRLNYDKGNIESRLNKIHRSELAEKESEISRLKEALEKEQQYRAELNELREHIFKTNQEYTPIDEKIYIETYLDKYQLLIIGGPKEWRRKIRDKYPTLKTLNGFNENFELRLLNNSDYIFFYTGFMSHATYNRAMNIIRNNRMKFGYIGKTNIELVEDEIAKQLKECFG